MHLAIKILNTCKFLNDNAGQPITYQKLHNFIIDTWGEEITQKLKSGAVDFKDYLNYLQIPEEHKQSWIAKLNLYIERLKGTK